mmetsp:Transcript_29497/g.47538  ORF Transcript_29497/g.47538 Transcript_29497/m.47538 type:complete len:286 (-) Transcript_29497:1093-1950(-)
MPTPPLSPYGRRWFFVSLTAALGFAGAAFEKRTLMRALFALRMMRAVICHDIRARSTDGRVVSGTGPGEGPETGHCNPSPAPNEAPSSHTCWPLHCPHKEAVCPGLSPALCSGLSSPQLRNAHGTRLVSESRGDQSHMMMTCGTGGAYPTVRRSAVLDGPVPSQAERRAPKPPPRPILPQVLPRGLAAGDDGCSPPVRVTAMPPSSPPHSTNARFRLEKGGHMTGPTGESVREAGKGVPWQMGTGDEPWVVCWPFVASSVLQPGLACDPLGGLASWMVAFRRALW